MKKLLLILTMMVFIAGTASAATFHMTAPNGGEKLCLGKTFNITWTATGVTTPIRLVLRKGGVKLGDIINGLPAGTTSYSWTVGSYIGGTAPEGTDYKIRLRPDNAEGDPTDYDDSDANFTIKLCYVLDPHKYRYEEKIICKWPRPGCPGCPPDIDLRGLRERIGNPDIRLRLVLLKDGKPVGDLTSFGKGKGLPDSVPAKLGERDLKSLKNGTANFAVGLVGPDGNIANTYALDVQ